MKNVVTSFYYLKLLYIFNIGTTNVSVFESALGSKKLISLKGGKDSYEP